VSAKKPARPERRITITDVRRDPPDVQKLARAFLALAVAEAEAEAKAAEPHEAEQEAKQ
jgi:hypothetical protein